MSTQKIVGQCKTMMRGRVRLIAIYPRDVFLIGEGEYVDSYMLYHWLKPQYP